MSRSATGNPRVPVSWIALATSIAAIGLITLTPGSPAVTEGWTCIFCGPFATADAILNVVLFVPLGLSLGYLNRSTVRNVLIGFLISLSVEAAQITLVQGRDASVGDLITNTVGCAIGHISVTGIPWWLKHTRVRTGTQVFTAVVVTLAIVVLPHLLMRPSFPHVDYYGQWAPRRFQMGIYGGTILRASIGSQELPPSRITEPDSFRTQWSRGIAIEIGAVAGPEPDRMAPLFAVSGDRKELLLIGQIENDLFLRYRTIAASLRLHQPALVLAGAMRAVPGDTIAINVRRVGDEHCVVVDGDPRFDFGITPGSSWMALIQNRGLAARKVQLINSAWIALLLFPLGLWTGRRVAAAKTGLAILLVFSLAPPALGMPVTPITEFMGGIVGFWTGVFVRAGMINNET